MKVHDVFKPVLIVPCPLEVVTLPRRLTYLRCFRIPIHGTTVDWSYFFLVLSLPVVSSPRCKTCLGKTNLTEVKWQPVRYLIQRILWHHTLSDVVKLTTFDAMTLRVGRLNRMSGGMNSQVFYSLHWDNIQLASNWSFPLAQQALRRRF